MATGQLICNMTWAHSPDSDQASNRLSFFRILPISVQAVLEIFERWDEDRQCIFVTHFLRFRPRSGFTAQRSWKDHSGYIDRYELSRIMYKAGESEWSKLFTEEVLHRDKIVFVTLSRLADIPWHPCFAIFFVNCECPISNCQSLTDSNYLEVIANRPAQGFANACKCNVSAGCKKRDQNIPCKERSTKGFIFTCVECIRGYVRQGLTFLEHGPEAGLHQRGRA